ncbi:unnamed protein product [Schistosoma margrebowiei]|uniref:Uncharacterized protein n=1 Tax=Schistosoma margrebowiei TaxID=48269 RepID=A0AA84ZXL9_9TREM|nr:unnamed protein product [Schistosoma margrebowiei]
MLSEEKSSLHDKTDLSDRSVIFHKIRESLDTEPKARFEHDLNHVKTSLSKLLPDTVSGVSICKLYRIGKKVDSENPQKNRLLKRTFTKFDTTMFTTSLVRTKLENCVQAASPCLKGDSDILEKVQRTATRGILELRGLSYKERLEKLNLFTLSYRRLRGDLILIYRILRHDFGPKLFSLFLPTRSGHLRGHSRRVEKPRTNKIPVAYRFSHRVINTWNLLPHLQLTLSREDWTLTEAY